MLVRFYACSMEVKIKCKVNREKGKGRIEREEGRKMKNIEKGTKWVIIVKKREHKSMELSTDRTEKDKKSLVSLVSSTRLKGQMESQWGSLSGSHYWNRNFFFLFTYTQNQSWKQLALRESSVFLPNEWNKSVCLHSQSHIHTPMVC